MKITVNSTAGLLDAVNTAGHSAENIDIILQSGVYEIEKTIALPSNASLCGEDGAVLKGTKRLYLEGAEITDGRYVIDLEKAGVFDTGRFGLGPYVDFWEKYDIPKPHMTENGPSMELYFGNKKMNISRFPKTGYTYIEKALGKTPIFFPGINGVEGKSGTAEGIFIPENKEIFDSNKPENMLLIGFWNYNWASQRHIITSYDRETKVITVDEEFHNFGYIDSCRLTPTGRGKFFILNLLTEVKQPGDWYIDRTENKLYLIPYEGQDFVDISLCENLFEAKDKENITVKNISVFGCRKSAFQFTGCKNVLIEGCNINDVGAWGAILDDCTHSTVSRCHIYNTGGGGIACSGGDRNTLSPSENVVKLNTIHDISYWHKTYLAGIEVNGVGVHVCQNNIYDVPHFGIVFQGNDHVFEKNTISNACFESNDAGAFYAGRDYTCRGNIIRYNLIKDLRGAGGHGCIGLYFDDGMSSAEVYGNIFSSIPFAGIMLGGGRDFDIHDNFFYDCNIALHFDNRIVADGGYMNDKLLQHLSEVPYRSDVWKEKYPLLYNIMDNDRKQPLNNKFRNNTIVGGFGIALINGANGDKTSDNKFESCLIHKDNKFIKCEDSVLNRHYSKDTKTIWED